MYVVPAPTMDELSDRLGGNAALAAMTADVDVVPRERYPHWDKLRHLEPPPGLSREQWWLRIKLARVDGRRQLALTDPSGRAFSFGVPELVERHLHRIDRHRSGELGGDLAVGSERDAGRRYLVNSTMEEAIRSSQLEGATTARPEAKELLRSGRPPQDRSERMIFNHYRALRFMREEMGDVLTPDGVLDLHRVLTEGTLDDPDAAGRLQLPGEERVAVHYRDEDQVPTHRPPPAEQLPGRIELMCRFANEGEDGEEFVHPVVRSILLHFWLAYDHPFADGNGRTARVLFFWSMRKRGYRLVELLPISRLLREAPAQYSRAFMETEADERDATYFLLHQLRIIERSFADLEHYVERKRTERREAKRLLDSVDRLNGRQVVLLTHAIKHPDHTYTFGGHAHSNRVTHETARADLGDLGERGFLTRRRRGRSYVFEPAPDLPERLRESGG